MLDKMTKKQLLARANEKGMDVQELKKLTKKEIIFLLEEAKEEEVNDKDEEAEEKEEESGD